MTSVLELKYLVLVLVVVPRVIVNTPDHWFDRKQLPLEVLQNAVLEIPAKLEELALLKVRLWLVLEYLKNGNFRECWYSAEVGIFQFLDRNSR